ncbi:MAG: hypothetical protein AAGI46_06900 [Planctomycetota bacterium]
MLQRVLIASMVSAFGGSTALAEVSPGPWQRVPWVSQEHRDAGVRIGGEGAQWPGDLAIDQTDGSLMVFATDVGGLYRSTDQGKTWEPANVGFTPRGARDVEIDPNNPQRVLAIGSNSLARDIHGVWLSEDGAASWEIVEPANMGGMRDRRRSVVFDPASYDASTELTRRVYWSRTNEKVIQFGKRPDPKPGLYRSDDGGRIWQRLGESADVAGASEIEVHPTTGRVYAGNENGFFLSDDGGETFRKTSDLSITTVATHKDYPDRVWAATATALHLSEDAGETWSPMETVGLDEPLTMPDGSTDTLRTDVRFEGLMISPADANRLAMRSLADDWQWRKHVSDDGGKSWQVAPTSAELAFLPQNARQYTFAWHPTDPDRVWSYGGDWITASTDGGQSFAWASEGQNAVLVGGGVAFNPHHPELIFLGSQDYNGAVTHDGGHTWTYTNASGKEWGGFTYGGVAINPAVLVVGLAPSWTGDRQLRISKDGGETWADVVGVSWAKNRGQPGFGSSRGYVHPTQPDTAFVSRFRTTDAGETWQPMDGVTGVYAHDSLGRVYGLNQQFRDTAYVVRSDDGGTTWTPIAEHPGLLMNVSVTADGTTAYSTDMEHLLRFNLVDGESVTGEPIDSPSASTGRRRVTSVAVDPKDADVLYITQHLDIESSDVAVCKSFDGGETWHVLNRIEPLDGTMLDGGRESISVNIDPRTGHVWTPTSCYGIWKYVPDREIRQRVLDGRP